MGYGYVRDDKPTQINWGEIGKQMTDSIAAEVVNRESRKAAIDTASNEYSKSLLDQPQGSNAESNRFMADFSKDASSQAKRDLDDLKSGRISERDYYKRRANLGQGTELMFKAGESFNANYDKAMERLSSGISSNEEIFDRSMMEGYLNFSSTGAYINPLTGEVNVAKRIKNNDGSGFRLSNNPGEFSNASELLRLSTAQYDKYDLQGAVVKAVEGLGEQAYKDGLGNNTTQAFNALYSDEAGRKKMQAAKASMIESFTANENHVSSILSDRLGYKYTMSAEDAAADSNLILKNPDGSKDFTTANGKKQLAAAKKEVGDLFEASLDVKITERAELTKNEIERLRLEQQRIDISRGKIGKKSPDFQTIKFSVNKEIDALDFTDIDFTSEESVFKLKEILSPYVDIEETDIDDVIILSTQGKEDMEIPLDLYYERGDTGVTGKIFKEKIKDYITPASEDEVLKYVLKYGDLRRKKDEVDEFGVPIQQ